MKRKELLILTIVAAITSGINATDDISKEHIHQYEANKKSASKVFDPRDEIIQKLLSEFNSALEIKRLDLKFDLEAISRYYDTGYNFGDESSNITSLHNWAVYTRSLHALHKLGYGEYGSKLQEELDRAKRRLETIDFYTDGRDYKYCLSGIWSIVAIFNTQEREKFIKALEKGEEIPRSENTSKMVKELSFDYK